jgi:hypothetical protein
MPGVNSWVSLTFESGMFIQTHILRIEELLDCDFLRQYHQSTSMLPASDSSFLVHKT